MLLAVPLLGSATSVVAFECRPAKLATRSVDLEGSRHVAVAAVVTVGSEAVTQDSTTRCAQALFAGRLAGEVARTPGADAAVIDFAATPAAKPAVQFIFRKTDGTWRLL